MQQRDENKNTKRKVTTEKIIYDNLTKLYVGNDHLLTICKY